MFYSHQMMNSNSNFLLNLALFGLKTVPKGKKIINYCLFFDNELQKSLKIIIFAAWKQIIHPTKND